MLQISTAATAMNAEDVRKTAGNARRVASRNAGPSKQQCVKAFAFVPHHAMMKD
jgi:hypothetical protein